MSKSKLELEFPPPIVDEDDLYVWKPIVRVGKSVPWGYEKDEEDSDILIPIPTQLELLELAKHYLQKYSYRDVAAWLSEQSGRSISHVGLYKRVKSENKRKRETANQRLLAQRYKEALEKAKKLEEGHVGYRVDPSTGETYRTEY